MARWKLNDKHYINVPETEWEYKESDRETGRQARRVFKVPRYLDPADRTEWTDRANEMIVVANRFDPAFPRDLVFEGDPTPDMEPLDDEAREITERIRASGRWVHPIDSLNMNYSQSILSEFEKQIATMLAQGASRVSAPVVNLSGNGVDPEEFAKLQKQVALLVERNAQLEDALASKAPARRL